jgi:hypothetical protein
MTATAWYTHSRYVGQHKRAISFVRNELQAHTALQIEDRHNAARSAAAIFRSSIQEFFGDKAAL